MSVATLPTRKDEAYRYADLSALDRVWHGLAPARRIDIPAGEKRYVVKTQTPPLPADLQALNIFPHMHYLGREMKAWAEVPGAANYSIWQRRTDAADWGGKPVIEKVVATSAKLEGVRGDDWIFGVSACSADGVCSPVASAVPGGAFAPLPAE